MGGSTDHAAFAEAIARAKAAAAALPPTGHVRWRGSRLERVVIAEGYELLQDAAVRAMLASLYHHTAFTQPATD